MKKIVVVYEDDADESILRLKLRQCSSNAGVDVIIVDKNGEEQNAIANFDTETNGDIFVHRYFVSGEGIGSDAIGRLKTNDVE